MLEAVLALLILSLVGNVFLYEMWDESKERVEELIKQIKPFDHDHDGRIGGSKPRLVK